MTKAILFDAFGTLFSLDIQIDEIQQLAPNRWNELLRLWREKQLSRSWLFQSMGKYEDFNEVSKKSLEQSMKELGLTNHKILELLLPIYQNPKAFEDVLPALVNLKSFGCKAFILSNGTPAMLSTGIRNTGLEPVLEGFVSVDEIKQYKPARDVYRHAVKKVGYSMEEIIFVSSNQWDVAGASNAGLDSIWLNRGQLLFEDFGFIPKAVIASLHELVELLTTNVHHN